MVNPEQNPYASPQSNLLRPRAAATGRPPVDANVADARLTRLLPWRRRCLITIGVLSLLGGLFVGVCALHLVPEISLSSSWLKPLTVAAAALYGPALCGLGAWCLAQRPSSIFAAIAIPLLWIAIAGFLLHALDRIETEIYDHPLYVGLTIPTLELEVCLGAAPAFIALPLAVLAAFLEWRIRHWRFELSESTRLGAPENSTI